MQRTIRLILTSTFPENVRSNNTHHFQQSNIFVAKNAFHWEGPPLVKNQRLFGCNELLEWSNWNPPTEHKLVYLITYCIHGKLSKSILVQEGC